jgi:uncharacterized protein YPO0396
MQLSVFSTDEKKSGFRLQYLEVLNWGTFDGQIYSIRPLGETSLLTGANGSGKTTFIDALLTLMVPEKRMRFYNQSSGARKKDDRTEESYLLGGFGSVNTETSGTTRTEYLRPDKEKAYSILLAHFSNEAEQMVTLFQVRYYAGGEMKKYFGIGHKALSIEEDFKPFDLGGNWKRALDQRYSKGTRRQVEWFDAASRYAQRLVELLGMQSLQALQLFNQTVGIKVLGNLDEFIRTNMLEPRNMEEEFHGLKDQLATLLDARRNMEKAEAQIALLQPLEEYHDQAASLKQELEQCMQSTHAANIWRSYTKHELLGKAITEGEGLLTDTGHKLQAAKTALATLAEDERAIRNGIEGNKAGQRLRDLEAQMADREAKLAAAQKLLTTFTSWATQLKLQTTDAQDETSYAQIKRETDKAMQTLNAEKRSNDDELFAARNKQKTAAAEQEALEQQLNSMQQSRNNMDWWLTDLRKRLCDALDIDTAELPFAGELMQVSDEHMEWQPALERLLGSFAMRLLVPEQHYKRVNRYVNNNNIRAKLVYERVGTIALSQYPEPGTVPDKLDFHPDHELSEWLEQEVIKRFRYSCLEDEKAMDRYDKAITLNGLVKDGRRHEKDDRPDKTDASRYVMGWNNEKKKEALLSKRAALVSTMSNTEEVIRRCDQKSKRIGDGFYAGTRIKEHAGFDEVNTAAIAKSLQKLKGQAEELRKGNEALDALHRQLEGIRQAMRTGERERDEYLRAEALQVAEQERRRSELKALQPLISALDEEAKDRLLQFQQQYAEKLSAARLDNVDSIYQELRAGFERELSDLRDRLNSAEKKILTQINKIRNPVALIQKFPDWPADVQHLPEDPKYVGEYIEWLARLTTENLPKYRRDFENFINVTITHKIAGLKEALDKWERDIEGSVRQLNKSLGGINFNKLPDTYIQLGKRALSAGTDIREFRQQLLEALPQAANWQQDSFEAKALHFTEKVQPLIASLDSNEAYRAKVLDVRNWFEFWADEKYRSNDELKKTYKQMGQLSGGEKAQLTYTILCSAIAYQFGITREGLSSKSLRFIAVDESFSNQDEEKATYLMELCRELHLQLLVVTPSDKIGIVQDFIAHVHLVQRAGNHTSTLYNMTIKELKARMETAGAQSELLNMA